MAEPIILRLPSKYAPQPGSEFQAESASSPSSPQQQQQPSTEWLARTWTVTHSTLAMWRSARNVRITYTPLPAKSDGRPRIDDLVEYEPTSKTGVLKSVAGVDTQAPGNGGWTWRGKGWLAFVSSHWEIIGWGEEDVGETGQKEKWAVTWFAKTVFTQEGLDILSSRPEGLSENTHGRIAEALGKLGVKPLVDMTAKNMQAVEIKLPWVVEK
ncbi:hypothetical protein AAL_02831 [Moelleriella libera RCEF 2490]|uniref:Histidinolphosphatase-like protein n=1 Tax=Moelleriella libera RCEF 2490 TaxID=1081109 RepID=A0A168E150_9HYPO|nr:hypothetical protein AAL_02831 [Moelleriella libera RCEF 2490]